MKKVLLITILILISFQLSSSVFQVNKLGSLAYIAGITSLEFLNNHYDSHNIFPLSENDINKISKNNVLKFDRIAFQPYSPKLKDLSDYTIYFTFASALYFSFEKEEILNNLVVLTEVMVTQNIIGKWTKSFSKRKRPFVYDENISISKKQEHNSQHSFYSLHSSAAFSAATYAYYYLVKKNGRNIPAALVLYGSATATASLRVASANHFPSDVIIGAVMGSAISYFICEYHHKKQINIQVGFNSLNLEISF